MLLRHKTTGEVIHEFPPDWRREADLRGLTAPHGDFSNMDLEGIDFSGANLAFACFQGANLRLASFVSSDLTHTKMQNADLRNSYLREANLRWSDLRNANLARAELNGTNFTGATLEGMDFTGAVLWDTVFADCQDLHLAIGLADLQHDGPSCLDLRTMRSSLFALPDEFLLGIGWTTEEVEGMRGLFPEPSL